MRRRSVDLPEPLGPVTTTSRSRGTSTSTLRRLCVRAPRMRILSSAAPAEGGDWSIIGCTAGPNGEFPNGPVYQIHAAGATGGGLSPGGGGLGRAHGYPARDLRVVGGLQAAFLSSPVRIYSPRASTLPALHPIPVVPGVAVERLGTQCGCVSVRATLAKRKDQNSEYQKHVGAPKSRR